MTADLYDLTRHETFKTPGRRRNNWKAVAAPTVTDDSSKEYEVGSRWYDVLSGRLWTCLVSTPGAAVWRYDYTHAHDLESLTDVDLDQTLRDNEVLTFVGTGTMVEIGPYAGPAPTASATGLLSGTAAGIANGDAFVSDTLGAWTFQYARPQQFGAFSVVDSYGHREISSGKVESSDDGTTWVERGNWSGLNPGPVYRTFTVQHIKARWWRFTVLGAENDAYLQNFAYHVYGETGIWVNRTPTAPPAELTVEEADGLPLVPNVEHIIAEGMTVTDEGSGVVRLTVVGGGGGGPEGAVVGYWQATSPGTPPQDEALWFDTDAVSSGGGGSGAAVAPAVRVYLYERFR